MNYYYSLIDGDFTYNIDMIRLKTYISAYELKKIKPLLEQNSSSFFSSSGFGKFALNYKFSALWTGLGSINAKKDGKVIWCIEVNPNKMDYNDFEFLQWATDNFTFNLTRYDLAIDIPYNINQLYFGDLYKKSFSMFYNDYDNKTYYFGKGSGHTKIYNKKIESNLDYELTRYEVTLETDFDFLSGLPPAHNINFITICRTPYFSLSGDPSLDAILYAVNSGFPFKSLSRRYKDYIKKDFIRFE